MQCNLAVKFAINLSSLCVKGTAVVNKRNKRTKAWYWWSRQFKQLFAFPLCTISLTCFLFLCSVIQYKTFLCNIDFHSQNFSFNSSVQECKVLLAHPVQLLGIAFFKNWSKVPLSWFFTLKWKGGFMNHNNRNTREANSRVSAIRL